MFLTDMDDALANFKFPYFTETNWLANHHGEMSSVRGILIHHTGGGGKNDYKVVRDGRPGLEGPLAQIVFERDGRARIISAGQCWHAGTGTHPNIGTNNGNARMIGIEGVCNGRDWSDIQREQYPRLAASLAIHYKVPVENVLGHKEWATPRGRKPDPGNWDMDVFRASTRLFLTNKGAPSKPVIRSRKKILLLGD